MKLNKSVTIPVNGSVAKTISILALISMVLGLYMADLALKQPFFSPGSNHYTYENIGRGLLVSSTVLILILKLTTPGIYWMNWLKFDKTKPDERQKAVRQRVYERGYAYLLASTLVLLIILDTGNHEIRFMVGWVVVLLAASLPSMLAAWQRDA